MTSPVKSRWIENTGPDDPVHQVAARALQARLSLVSHYLPLAAEKPEQDVEYVHQLRVSTRRSAAAISIFRQCLPSKRRRQLRNLLKRIRRAAGPARDDDVLLLRLSEEADTNPQSPAELLRADIAEHRSSAQADIVKVHQRAGQQGLPQQIENLIEKCQWRGRGEEPKLRGLADASLQKLSRRLWQRSNQVTTPESLHQLRILGKRLRYAMELFAGAYPDSFRNLLYPQVEKLQDLLGAVNDHAVARQRFRDWLQAAAPDRAGAIQSLLADEEQALGESRAAFYRTFTPQHAEKMRTSFASLWRVG